MTQTFEQAALQWLQKGTSRNREPFRPRTAKTYKSQIETHLIPAFGKVAAHLVGNNEVAGLVKTMVGKFAPATIDLNVNVVKQIRKSLRDKDGNKLPPYLWDAEIIDAPILDKKLQKRPIPSAQAVQDALKCGSTNQVTLWALLASSGLRIKEALALYVGPVSGKSYWDFDQSKVVIVRQDTKTDAGVRETDLCFALNEFLKKTIPSGTKLFPKGQSHYRLALNKCGIKGGFHSLRRFRITHLRTEGVPDPLVHFWVGHEDKTVTDGYTIVKTEIEKRKQHVERVGLGFELPEVH